MRERGWGAEEEERVIGVGRDEGVKKLMADWCVSDVKR